jgi:hypothetical protein
MALGIAQVGDDLGFALDDLSLKLRRHGTLWRVVTQPLSIHPELDI